MTMGHRINQHDAPPAPVVSALSDEQFAVIVGLLTPVRDLAVAQLAMIAEAKVRAAAPESPSVEDADRHDAPDYAPSTESTLEV